MSLRTIATRVLVGAVLIAALCGIAALFVPGDDIGRLLGTALLAVVSASFLLGSVRMIERTSLRPTGLVIACATMTDFLLLLVAIWADVLLSGAGNLDENLGMSAGAIAACAIPLAVGARGLPYDRSRHAAILMLSAFSVVLVLCLGAIWLDIDDLDRVAIPISLCASLASLCLMRGTMRRWIVLTGVAAAAIATVIWSGNWLMISGWEHNASALSAVLATTGLATIVAFANVTLLRPVAENLRWIPPLSILLAGLCVMSVAWLIFNEVQQLAMPWFLGRLATGTGILGMTGLLSTAVLQRIAAAFFEQAHGTCLALTCPRCRRHCDLPQGRQRCPHCGLQMRLQFEPPTCRNCDYDLSATSEERCPECGEPLLTAD